MSGGAWTIASKKCPDESSLLVLCQCLIHIIVSVSNHHFCRSLVTSLVSYSINIYTFVANMTSYFKQMTHIDPSIVCAYDIVAKGKISVAGWNPVIDVEASSRTWIAEATSFLRLPFEMLLFPLEDASASWLRRQLKTMKSALTRLGILIWSQNLYNLSQRGVRHLSSQEVSVTLQHFCEQWSTSSKRNDVEAQ